MISQLIAYTIAITMIYGTLNLYVYRKNIIIAMLWTSVTVVYMAYSNKRSGFTVPANVDTIILLCGVILAVILIYTVIKWKHNEITGMSIKKALDSMPAGVCCYDDNGRLFIANNTMNRLCKEITGEWLRDGQALYEAVKGNSIVEAEDKFRQFSVKTLNLEGRRINELIAIDVTTEYKMTRQYYEKNAELENQNIRLRRYSNNITEITRQKEILAANRNIHDRLNWVLLATKHSIDNKRDSDERRNVLEMWKEDVIRLASDVQSTDVSTPIDDLIEAANSIGIKLTIEGRLPDDNSLIHVIMLATTECLTNAAKHAGAQNMNIAIATDIYSDKPGYTVRIFNDGRLADGEIKLGGGLSEIKRLAENVGGTMDISTDGRFELILRLPEEEY